MCTSVHWSGYWKISRGKVAFKNGCKLERMRRVGGEFIYGKEIAGFFESVHSKFQFHSRSFFFSFLELGLTSYCA